MPDLLQALIANLHVDVEFMQFITIVGAKKFYQSNIKCNWNLVPVGCLC